MIRTRRNEYPSTSTVTVRSSREECSETLSYSVKYGRGASLLLPVPGGEAGPSGVLVCGENWVAYKHQDHPEVRAPLPRRKTMPPGRGLLVTSGTLHQQPGLFFHLIQSELGDLYKVSFLVVFCHPSRTAFLNHLASICLHACRQHLRFFQGADESTQEMNDCDGGRAAC